jgi:hypothetical protein
MEFVGAMQEKVFVEMPEWDVYLKFLCRALPCYVFLQ